MKETFFNQPTNPQEKKTEQDAYFFVDDFKNLKKDILSPKKRCDYDPRILEQIISLNPSEQILKEAEKENYKGDLEILKNFEEEKSGILYNYFGNFDRSFIDDRPDQAEKIKQTLEIIKSDDKLLERYPALLMYAKFSVNRLAPEDNNVKEMIKYIIKIGQNFNGDEMINKPTLSWNFYFNQILKKNPEFAGDCLLESLKSTKPNADWGMKLFIIALTNLIGAEEARQKINEAITKEKDQGTINNLEYARAFFTPNHDKIAIENLRGFYEKKIKFENYGLNEKMLEKEVKLLKDLIDEYNNLQGGASKILEMGCGPGRLIEKLVEDGYDITGFDNVPRHTQITKEKIEKMGKPAKVFEGDWRRNAIKDESFDVVYSLGRNVLHDYSLPDQLQLFREAARILKKGGQFIFDIPDRDKGKYKLMVKAYKNEMEKRAIRNFRYGSIYDSPDGKNFATRYAYSNEDIEQLATLAGFRIKESRRLPLETGADDESLYYVLEKI